MGSEITPAAPWSPILVIHIRPQVETRQSQSYKLKKIVKNSNFELLQEPIHPTHLLKLRNQMSKHEMDPTRTVGATERTRDAGQMDGRTEWNQYTPPTTSLCGGIMMVTLLTHINVTRPQWVKKKTLPKSTWLDDSFACPALLGCGMYRALPHHSVNIHNHPTNLLRTPLTFTPTHAHSYSQQHIHHTVNNTLIPSTLIGLLMSEHSQSELNPSDVTQALHKYFPTSRCLLTGRVSHNTYWTEIILLLPPVKPQAETQNVAMLHICFQLTSV